MENYRFAKHNLSKKVIDYAAKTGISASELRNTKFGYNHSNILAILENRLGAGTARLDDLAVAEKVYNNIRKMSHAKRAKVDYDTLKSRAKKVYESLYSADLIEDRAECARKEMRAKYEKKQTPKTIEHVVAMDNRVRGKWRKAGNAGNSLVIGTLGVLGVLTVIGMGISYFKKNNMPEAVGEYSSPADAPAPGVPPAPAPVAPPLPVYAPEAPKADAPAPAAPSVPVPAPETPRAVEVPSVLPPAEAPAHVTPSVPVTVPEAPKAQKPAAPKHVEKKEEPYVPVIVPGMRTATPETPTPRQAYQQPRAAETAQPSKGESASGNGSGISVRGILDTSFYFDKDTIAQSGTAKTIIDFGKIGLDVYANGFNTRNNYDTSDVDGLGGRVWATGHAYVPTGNNTFLYGAAGGGVQKRDYTIAFDRTGHEFTYGDTGHFLTASLGFTEGRVDPDDYGVVGSRHSYALAQWRQHSGNTTGDAADRFGDHYGATSISAKARWMVPGTDFSVEAGGNYFSGAFDEFLRQHSRSVQAGVRWHAGSNVHIELDGRYERNDDAVAGNRSHSAAWGPQAGVGWRILRGPVTIDATVNAGYLFERKDDNNWFVMPGVRFSFGN